jgi:hypothetical protein
MIRNLLIRGMIAGLVAGLLGFGFAKTFGEPSVDRAIAFESQQEQAQERAEAASGHAHQHGGGDEIVSRGTQAGLGLMTGVAVFGAALGGLFSLVFAFSYARIGALRARGTSALLALLGFVTVVITPFLKYPPNPPSVGNPETIGARTAFFFGMVAVSLVVAGFAVRLQRRLQPARGNWNASLIAVAGYVVLMGLAYIALPSVDEVPPQFSATLLWNFRVAAIGIQAVIWTTLALLFGVLAQRELEHVPARPVAAA